MNLIVSLCSWQTHQVHMQFLSLGCLPQSNKEKRGRIAAPGPGKRTICTPGCNLCFLFASGHRPDQHTLEHNSTCLQTPTFPGFQQIGRVTWLSMWASNRSYLSLQILKQILELKTKPPQKHVCNSVPSPIPATLKQYHYIFMPQPSPSTLLK